MKAICRNEYAWQLDIYTELNNSQYAQFLFQLGIWICMCLSINLIGEVLVMGLPHQVEVTQVEVQSHY
jgi:hypothetical protein